MEPFHLKRWRSSSPEGLILHTCARPGRSKGRNVTVSDAIVDKWIKGLPGDGDIAIVSLLGRKGGPGGDSEFKFYSFHGAWDHESERRKRVSFQEWIDSRHFGRSIEVVEHPTYDSKQVPNETLEAVSADIHRLLRKKICVVLIDSGGVERTGQLCKFMNFVEHSASS